MTKLSADVSTLLITYIIIIIHQYLQFICYLLFYIIWKQPILRASNSIFDLPYTASSTNVLNFKYMYFRMETSVEYAMLCASGRRRQSLQKLAAKQEKKFCSC